jgi:hypothetical protein
MNKLAENGDFQRSYCIIFLVHPTTEVPWQAALKYTVTT